jgi:uncharacterized Fe-S cluster-containing radical SAM superfamily protein
MEPFDPLELAKQTERIVCQGDRRKYTEFYATGVYGGIATGYACGCCLRCIFCWADLSREFPESYGRFYSPKQVYKELRGVAQRHHLDKARISGAEPTLGRGHLIPLLRLVEESPFSLFILETNGILFGPDPTYIQEVSRFKKVHTRISLKAGTPEGFRKRMRAKPEAFILPFQAIQSFLRQGGEFPCRFHECGSEVHGWRGKGRPPPSAEGDRSPAAQALGRGGGEKAEGTG